MRYLSENARGSVLASAPSAERVGQQTAVALSRLGKKLCRRYVSFRYTREGWWDTTFDYVKRLPGTELVGNSPG